MATAVARIAFMGDSVGNSGSNTPKVAAAVDAAFGRFGPGIANCYAIFGGDTYSPYATSSSMQNYDQYYNKANIVEARSIMTPGNHDNGIGGASQPSAQAWLSYNATKSTHTNVTGGWINQAEGIPNTDQFWDIGGFRFFFINSGAVVGGNANPGWPVPHLGGTIGGNARVNWLRANWASGLKNIVVTHHPRWSYYGNHHDNPEMQNLWDEILGKNDGSGPHSCLVLSGHDHNMQLFQPQSGAGQYPGLTAAVIGLGSTSPYTGAGPANQTSQKSWLQFANFTSGAAGFLQIDLMDDFSIVMSVIDAADTSGALMTNTSSSGITGAATSTIVTSVSAPTITYQYRVDGGSWVNNSTALTRQLTGLAPGPHVMDVKRLSGATESDVSSYAWTVPVPIVTSPVIENVTDQFGQAVTADSTIQSQDITFDVGRTEEIPAGVPDTSMWLYKHDYVGCIVGASPKNTSPTTQKAFANGRREFYSRTTADGNAQFNPNGKDETGAQVYPVGDDFTNYATGTLIPYMQDKMGLGHPMDFIVTFMGRRQGETVGAAELTWPSTGWTAFTNWVYGDNSYVDQCVNRWATALALFPRRVVLRLWHEYRNSTTYVTDVATAANYVTQFQKMAIRLRQLNVLYTGPGSTGKHLLAWNPADETGLDGTGHPSTLWFPGTYPTTPGGVDIIANDVYSTIGQTPPNAGFAQLQDWYDMFKRGSVNNPDNVPIYIVEAGLDITDASRIAHLTELIGDGTNPGLLQTNYPDVKLWTYWDGAGKELVDTPAGFQQAFSDGITTSYFLPSNIVPAQAALMCRLDGADLGKVDSPLTLTVDPGSHTVEFWTDSGGVVSDKATFSWTVVPIQHGEGSGTYVKQIPLNKNVGTAEIWVRAVGDDGVSTVAKRNVSLDLNNPTPGQIIGVRGSTVVSGGAISTTVTLDATAVAAGNSLVLCWLSNNESSIDTITDTDAHTWTKDDEFSNGSFYMMMAHVGLPSGQAASKVITLHSTGGVNITRRIVKVLEVKGILTSSALLDFAHAQAGSGTAMDSTLTDTPNPQPGAVVIGIGAVTQTIADADWDLGVGFARVLTDTIGSTNIKSMMLEWKWDPSSGGVYKADMTRHTSTGTWMSMVGVFKSVVANVYEPGVGFDFPDESSPQQTATIPVEVSTSDDVTSVQVTIDNVNFFPLTNLGTVDGIITWQGAIDIPVDGSLATITTVATNP